MSIFRILRFNGFATLVELRSEPSLLLFIIFVVLLDYNKLLGLIGKLEIFLHDVFGLWMNQQLLRVALDLVKLLL